MYVFHIFNSHFYPFLFLFEFDWLYYPSVILFQIIRPPVVGILAFSPKKTPNHVLPPPLGAFLLRSWVGRSKLNARWRNLGPIRPFHG
ncbi:hypothetical protein HanXRQr2_Chr16g0774361 [Helianthus annuus]|uniref:Uncharacterized protein n=1 Tax=Helianthus annuus TaxID=4232 RepID=A0A9K3H2F4_HELAN|nr:hypothetical protein HanXRQr2_Chr16g0774361 [Helianthus annuus]